MRIKIAGGCGEHGRNCFYIEGVSCTFLVDCGLMAGEEEGGYPNLTEKEIQKSYKNEEDVAKPELKSKKDGQNFVELNKKYNIEAQNEVLEDIIEEYDENHYRVK